MRGEQTFGPAVMLVQLGTPDAPEPGPVRDYLREFLSDQRVVELPPLLWQPILRTAVLTLRPAISARKYRKIWMAEGSPLLVHTARQARALQQWLDAHPQAGPGAVRVVFGMRYGNPSMQAALASLCAQGCESLLLVPMYPQYAASTTASACDALAAWLAQRRDQPASRTIRDFHQDEAWIDAVAGQIDDSWQSSGRPDHLLMSFHGIPQRSADAGDPYPHQCARSAALIAARLGLSAQNWGLAFQSRFGRARWVGPSTSERLAELGSAGVRRVDVACPGFVADCLETLEEIAIEGRQTFLDAGGKEFNYLSCLNDAPRFIDALGSLVLRNLGGWLPQRRDAAHATPANKSGHQASVAAGFTGD